MTHKISLTAMQEKMKKMLMQLLSHPAYPNTCESLEHLTWTLFEGKGMKLSDEFY